VFLINDDYFILNKKYFLRLCDLAVKKLSLHEGHEEFTKNTKKNLKGY